MKTLSGGYFCVIIRVKRTSEDFLQTFTSSHSLLYLICHHTTKRIIPFNVYQIGSKLVITHSVVIFSDSIEDCDYSQLGMSNICSFRLEWFIRPYGFSTRRAFETSGPIGLLKLLFIYCDICRKFDSKFSASEWFCDSSTDN